MDLVLLADESQKRLVILERTEQIRPGVIKGNARLIIDHVLDQESIITVILDGVMIMIAFRVVVGIVEWKRNRVAIRWRRFAVRYLRQHTSKLQHARFPLFKGLALRIG